MSKFLFVKSTQLEKTLSTTTELQFFKIKNAPIATSIQNYIDLAVKYANRDDIRALKNSYKTAAEKKLFNTKKAGEEFNKIISNLFN